LSEEIIDDYVKNQPINKARLIQFTCVYAGVYGKIITPFHYINDIVRLGHLRETARWYKTFHSNSDTMLSGIVLPKEYSRYFLNKYENIPDKVFILDKETLLSASPQERDAFYNRILLKGQASVLIDLNIDMFCEDTIFHTCLLNCLSDIDGFNINLITEKFFNRIVDSDDIDVSIKQSLLEICVLRSRSLKTYTRTMFLFKQDGIKNNIRYLDNLVYEKGNIAPDIALLLSKDMDRNVFVKAFSTTSGIISILRNDNIPDDILCDIIDNINIKNIGQRTLSNDIIDTICGSRPDVFYKKKDFLLNIVFDMTYEFLPDGLRYLFENDLISLKFEAADGLELYLNINKGVL
jgi:hypothetical protein